MLVFAPHPDDEVIGCGGVIQQALAAGRRVRIVFSTNGDGYPLAAARLLGKTVDELGAGDMARLGQARRGEAVAAARTLGLGESSLVFLGHRDAALEPAEPRALPEFIDVLQASRPSEVYVSAGLDEHADHRATYRLVEAAMREVEPKPRLLTYMVHSGKDTWPPAGPRFERGSLDVQAPWPPPIRVRLTPEQSATKLRALKAHATQWALDHDYLGRFVKEEEVFWQ
jgi:LmbE family N-acetylglucosaminyl deacetylase